MAEVVGDPGYVVHVPVRDAQVVAREGKLRRAADIEADVQIRNLNHRLLAGHAVSDDGELSQRQLGKTLGKVVLSGYVWGGVGHRICPAP